MTSKSVLLHLLPPPTLSAFTRLLCVQAESFHGSFKWWWLSSPEGVSVRSRGPMVWETSVHAQDGGMSTTSQGNTAEAGNKYTKYTSVFITGRKHCVLHFKNATIELLAQVCTKQGHRNACYKALSGKIQTLIPGEKERQENQRHYGSVKDKFLKIITNWEDTEPKHYQIGFKEAR